MADSIPHSDEHRLRQRLRLMQESPATNIWQQRFGSSAPAPHPRRGAACLLCLDMHGHTQSLVSRMPPMLEKPLLVTRMLSMCRALRDRQARQTKAPASSLGFHVSNPWICFLLLSRLKLLKGTLVTYAKFEIKPEKAMDQAQRYGSY